MGFTKTIHTSIKIKPFKTLFFLSLSNTNNFGKCSNYNKDKNQKVADDTTKEDAGDKKKDEKPIITKPKTAKNRLPEDVTKRIELTREDFIKLGNDGVIKKILDCKNLTLYDCITGVRKLYSYIEDATGEKNEDLNFTLLTNIVNGKIISGGNHKKEIQTALIKGFTKKAEDFNKKITDYCTSNQSKFFESIENIDSIDIDKFIEARLKIHKVDNITLEYSENDLKTLLKNLYSDMTNKYFTKKGAYSLIDKIILLYSNGFIDKFKATNNRKYYLTSLHIEHHPTAKFFNSGGTASGFVFSKDGVFYSFRENKECDEDCISCAMNKLLGEIGNIISLPLLSQPPPKS